MSEQIPNGFFEKEIDRAFNVGCGVNRNIAKQLFTAYKALKAENEQLKAIIKEEDIKLWICEKCGNIDTPDGFDVCGADIDNCFCNACGIEIPIKVFE